MSARAPRLSVVMPVYNGARELESSLPALRASTFRDFELIVVDDGSRDDVADVLARFPPDRVVTLDRNLGHCEARNRGAAEARGAILLFTDADVVVRPGTLGRVAERFEDEEVRSLIGLYGLDHPYRTLPSLYKNTWIHYTYRNAPAQVDWFFTAIGAVRADVWRRSGGFQAQRRREHGGGDIEFGHRLVRQGVPVRLDHGLEVTHLRRYTLAGLLRNDGRRAFGWTRLALESEASTRSAWRKGLANVSRGFALDSLGAAVLAVLLPLAGAVPDLRPAVAALAALYLLRNLHFLAFASGRFGLPYAVGFLAILFLDHLACATGVLRAVVGEPWRRAALWARPALLR